MPPITPLLWLLGSLALILLVLLAYIAARRWHQARISASHYRTASGRKIDADTHRILHQPMATRRVRAGPVSAISQAATHQALLAANNQHIREGATFAGRHDANTVSGRRPNPFATGTRSAILWFSWYEPAYLAALASRADGLASRAMTAEDMEFFGEEDAAVIWGINAVRTAKNAKNSTVQTTARHPATA